LCRRVRHLEHDLRDITARCHAEREHRITLEALVGVELPPLFDSMLELRSPFLTTVLLP
jgi:hypothetical protein